MNHPNEKKKKFVVIIILSIFTYSVYDKKEIARGVRLHSPARNDTQVQFYCELPENSWNS